MRETSRTFKLISRRTKRMSPTNARKLFKIVKPRKTPTNSTRIR